MTWTLLLLLSLVCFVLTGLLHFWSRNLGLVTERRLGRKRNATSPTSEGGAAFLLGFLICLGVSAFYLSEDLLLSASEMRSHHLGLALGLLWIWCAGRWGDRKGYPHSYALLVIMVGGAIAAGFGFTIHQVRVSGVEYELGGFSIPATLLWCLAISEFFRLFDGLDGVLVILVGAAVGMQLGILSVDEGYARLLCLATLPPLVGILPFRIYPARIELRGVGAYLPGFIFGAITMVGREKAFTTKAVLMPTVVLLAVFSLFLLWLLERRLFLPNRRD